MDGAPDSHGFLAGLTGFPPEVFGDAERGLRAVMRACDCHDVFGAPRDATEADRTLQALAAKHWQSRPWRRGFADRNLAFFRGEPAFLNSPLSGQPARVIGHLPLGARQATFAWDGGELVVLLSVGRAALGLFYPKRNRFLALTLRQLPWRPGLRDLVELILRHPVALAAWLRRGMDDRLTPAFLLGDNRMGHFVRDSLSYVDRAEDDLLLPLLRGGGRLLIARDICALDPLLLFPTLATFDPIETTSAAMTGVALEHGLSAHRVYRERARPDAEWLRRRLAALREAGGLPAEPPPAAPRFRLLVSVDAERQRFVNQVAALRLVLGRLGAACAEAGIDFEVAWDGWTVSGEPTAADEAVMARIRDTIAEATAGLHHPPARQVALFGRSTLGKVAATEVADLVLVTRGSGAILPSWLLRRPTLHFNVPTATDRSCLDESVAFDLPPGAEQDLSETQPDGRRPPRFALSLPALEATLARAVGDRLPALRAAPPLSAA